MAVGSILSLQLSVGAGDKIQVTRLVPLHHPHHSANLSLGYHF